jgi:hypothetical protein
MKKKEHLYKPGQSGNPKGRPPGATSKLHKALKEQAGDILQAMVKNALEGDTAAQKALLDKVLPNMKSVAPDVSLNIGADKSLVQKAEAILEAVASGQVAPDVGAVLVQSIGTLAKVAEVTELEERLESLEKIMEAKK